MDAPPARGNGVGVERRTSKNEVKVFKFGARKGQLENEALALDQIWLQNKYRNALVQIDREFRGRYNAIVSVDNPALDRIRKIGGRIRELDAAIKVQRTGVQRAGWKVLSLEEKAKKKALSAERKTLKPEADRVKLANKTTYEPQIKALDGEFYAATKAVKTKFVDGTYSYVDKGGNRHDLGGKKLFWMNEEHVYNNFPKDRDAAMRDKTVLNFHGYEGEGVVTCRPRVDVEKDSRRPMTVVRKVKGAKSQKISLPASDVAEFLASNPDAKIARADALRFKKLLTGELGDTQSSRRNITAGESFDPNNGSAFYITEEEGNGKTSKRGQRLRRVFAHIEIAGPGRGGSGKKRFFTLPVTLHRPFPEGSVVRSVAAKRERVGRKYRWCLLVTVDFPAPPPKHGVGVVALDPGWAMGTLPEPDGRLRVGGLTNEAGEFTELALPSKFMCQVEQVKRLQSVIAKETNAIMPKVQEWLGGHAEESDLRAHLQKAVLAHANAKRRQREAGGFRHLIRAAGAVWPDTLPPGRRREPAQLHDPEFEKAFDAWYKKFRHLDEWMRNLADQNDAHKLHQYREWAAQAAKRYHTVVIDDVDLRKAAEEPAADTDKAQPAGGQRQVAAPSLLVAAFVNAFKSAGGEARWVIGMTSRTCSECRHRNPALGASREFRCEQCGCGYTADRELNSGRNLINEHRAGRSTSERRSTKVRKPSAVLSNPEVFEKKGAGEAPAAVESTG